MITQVHKYMGKALKNKITLPDGVWSYRIGRYTVMIRNPERMRTYLAKVEEVVDLDIKKFIMEKINVV